MVRLLLAPAVESPRNSSYESCLLDLLAAARSGNGSLQRKTIGKCARQHKRGIFGAVGHCEEFDPVLVHRANMEEKDFIDKMGVYDVVPRSTATEKKVAVSFAPDGSRSIKGLMTLLSCVLDGSPKNSVAVAATSTSTSQRRPIWRWSKL